MFTAGNKVLSVPGEVDLECLAIILETKRRHGEKDIFAVDGLALLLLAFLRSFTRDERYELRDTLLHALFRFLGDFGILGQSRLHDPRDWSKILYVSVCMQVRFVGALERAR